MILEHKLLVCDLDNTLLGDDRSLARFAAWFHRYRSRLRLVYASSRFFRSAAQTVRHSRLPKPSVIVGGMGTEVRFYRSGRPIFPWEERLFACWDVDRVREVLARCDGLRPQPAEFQSDWKLSYCLRDASPDDLELIRAALRNASVEAELVYSSQRDLDVLPAGIDKGSAAKFLAEYFSYPAHDVIVCGDSGNDVAMFQHGFRGVVVANAQPELAAWQGPTVYHSGQKFAAGVLDGLYHWFAQDADPERCVVRERALVSV
jgi:sucrose-6F-phosphate phosphohydrolase